MFTVAILNLFNIPAVWNILRLIEDGRLNWLYGLNFSKERLSKTEKVGWQWKSMDRFSTDSFNCTLYMFPGLDIRLFSYVWNKFPVWKLLFYRRPTFNCFWLSPEIGIRWPRLCFSIYCILVDLPVFVFDNLLMNQKW